MDVVELEGLRAVGRICAEVRDRLGALAAPGTSTAELDGEGARLLAELGARSAPQLAYRFPGATCISVNDELAHGVPSRERVLREGDLVNIDVSAERDGWWADTGASFPVGTVDATRSALLDATRRALDASLEVVRPGAAIREVAAAVRRVVEPTPFFVVRNLCGHGVGRFIHAEPAVPNVFLDRPTGVFEEGMVVTLEPFLTTGARVAVQDPNGWTLRTPDGSIGAQFEHTIVVESDGALVLTESAS